jgi:hypothetical protein
MSEMVDRMARAVCRDNGAQCLCLDKRSDRCWVSDRVMIAILNEMREPTDAMRRVVDNLPDEQHGYLQYDLKYPIDAYQMMIDEALK